MTRWRRWLFVLGANVLALEALCVVAFVSGVVLSNPIYHDGWFDCPSCGLKAHDLALGWDSYPPAGVRPSPALAGRTQCGAVFGDSFTHADEVSDDEAWPNQLSVLLRCGVANMGVPGYGQDQAVLKYEFKRPAGQFAALGMYVEMLRRNFAASWRFYAQQADTLPKPYFLVSDNVLHLKVPSTEADRHTIRAHHAGDRYYEQFHVRFPYSLSLLRVLSYRLSVTARFSDTAALQGRRDTLLYPSFAAWNVPASIDLSKRLVARFASAVAADGKIPVIVMLPSVDYLREYRAPYERYLASVKAEHPDVCIVDTFPALTKYQREHGSVRAPRGHLGPEGNRVIAETLAAALKNECSLSFPPVR